MNNKWDYAWKVFCDPRLPWGRWFIDKLTEGRYHDYDVEASEITDLNVEQLQYDGVTYADKFLQFVVNDEKKILHLEFQSTYAANMCWRLLDYGLNFAKSTGVTTERSETYILPDAFIVNVRPTKFSGSTERTVTLEVHRQVVSLTYPVVNVTTSIPEFKSLISEKDLEKVREAILRLATLCGGFADANYSDTFLRACILASSAASYSITGMNNYEIESEVSIMNEKKLNWLEQAEENGRTKGHTEACQELLRNLMETMRITEQEARRMLKLDSSSGNTGVRNMQLH